MIFFIRKQQILENKTFSKFFNVKLFIYRFLTRTSFDINLMYIFNITMKNNGINVTNIILIAVIYCVF